MGIIMKLEASTLSYERFWDDQNKKLLAHPDFLESRGNLFDDVIYFKHRTVNSVTEINFHFLITLILSLAKEPNCI